MFLEEKYLDLLHLLLVSGEKREGRNGKVRSLFGEQVKYDLRDGFPLLTTKRVYWKGVVAELLWMLSGSTSLRYLHDNNVTIWDEWSDDEGELGPIYGKQWRSWNSTEFEGPFNCYPADPIDQIQNVIDSLKNDPYGRRHLVNAWNVGELDQMALPPCHFAFQFYVSTDGYLDCQLYQRSCDYFLGAPFNIASYSLLTHLIARECGYKPRYFIHTMGDVHLYENHVDASIEQLSRDIKVLPELVINGDKSIFDITIDDIELVGYEPHSTIKAEVSA